MGSCLPFPACPLFPFIYSSPFRDVSPILLSPLTFALSFHSIFWIGWGIGPNFSNAHPLKNQSWMTSVCLQTEVPCLAQPWAVLPGCAISTPLLFIHVLEIHKKVNFFFLYWSYKKSFNFPHTLILHNWRYHKRTRTRPNSETCVEPKHIRKVIKVSYVYTLFTFGNVLRVSQDS